MRFWAILLWPFFSHTFFYLCIYSFCPVHANLLDKLLNVKQASDMPPVQKSRHRIDPDAIPSPVSFLCACLHSLHPVTSAWFHPLPSHLLCFPATPHNFGQMAPPTFTPDVCENSFRLDSKFLLIQSNVIFVENLWQINTVTAHQLSPMHMIYIQYFQV